jgi:hypothetical protein
VTEQQRAWLQESARLLQTSSDFATALQCPKRGKLIARWILDTGCLQEFRLAVEIIDEEKQSEDAQRSRRRNRDIGNSY